MVHAYASTRDRFLISFFVVLVVLLFDQTTKWWITQLFFNFDNPLGFWDWFFDFGADLRPFDSREMTSFLNFVMVWNRGISFGFFGYGDEWVVWFLLALTITIVTILSRMVMKTDNRFMVVALSLIIGGALGNIWDRLRFGAVADFIDFHYEGWHYPAFNVADACVTTGVVLYLLGSFLIKQEE